MTAYYNENDPKMAAWLRELISAGHIAPGIVDERSIEDVAPNELAGYTQCHFFAGIGVWSHSLRQAGWPDDRPVWSGSCPCQPFSSAGKGAGFDDERHLWAAFHHLITHCGPSVVFGEQVASKAVDPWIDLVHADLEALGYAFGSVPFPSAGVGAPHIRDRNYWVADSNSSTGRQGGSDVRGGFIGSHAEPRAGLGGGGVLGGMAHPNHTGLEGRAGMSQRPAELLAGAGGVVDRPGPTNGFWGDADWLGCRDGKWRPVEPGTFPLVNGAAARVGRLRGFGNAINAKAAQAFIESFMQQP